MTLGEIAFLSGSIAAFVTFGVALAVVSNGEQSSRHRRTQPADSVTPLAANAAGERMKHTG